MRRRTWIGLGITAAFAGAGLTWLALQTGPSPLRPSSTDVPSGSAEPSACTPPAIPGGEATVFLAPSGRCLPTASLSLYRCGRRPAAVVEHGGRRFIGGRFAVAADELPADAVRRGRSADGTTVFTVPGDPRWLFVERNGSIQRWLELPRDPVSPTVLFIGDSITDGGEPALTAAMTGWTVSFDAVVGRPSSGGIAPAATAAAAAPSPSVVVVELGTNDADPATFHANLLQILTSLQAARLVVWQTVRSPAVAVPAIDADGVKLVGRFPNTVIADWAAFVPQGALSTDGVHPAPGHEALMAKLYQPLLQGWLDAAAGAGATSCIP